MRDRNQKKQRKNLMNQSKKKLTLIINFKKEKSSKTK